MVTCQVGRDEQIEWALDSHAKAVVARDKGYFADEVCPHSRAVVLAAAANLLDQPSGWSSKFILNPRLSL